MDRNIYCGIPGGSHRTKLYRDRIDMMGHQRHPTEKPLPPVSVYWVVGVILVIVTAVEVAAFYLDVALYILVPIFIVLSLFKFALVIMFFMHLRYDHKIFSTFFMTGVLLACGIFLGLIILFDNFDVGDPPVVALENPIPTATPTYASVDTSNTVAPTVVALEHSIPTATPTYASVDTSNTVAPKDSDGQRVFLSKGCSGCHKIEGLEGAVGLVGPNLTGISNRAGNRTPGMTAEEYVRASIEAPNAYIVEGFQNVMPPLRASMTDGEFESLVDYLLTLR